MRRTPRAAWHKALLTVAWIWPCGSLAQLGGIALADDASQAAHVDFDRDVAPLLARRCLECHSSAAHEGNLDLTTRPTLLTGGDTGAAAVPGDAASSLIVQRITAQEMPPENPLPEDEQALIRRWIDEGLVWRDGPLDPFEFTTDARAGYDWWSLQPVVPPPIPALDTASDPGRNAIDRFIRARLTAIGLTPSGEADRRVLIRRLFFDLTGLPPAPEQISQFLDDPAPDAYERLVDRLLSSSHYGERWARHWLDLARFGESQGFERDKLRPNAWPYRDWLITALNEDLPYDEFARRQIAGDVLEPETAAGIIATGFLVAGAYDEVGQNQQSAAMRAVVRQDELEDLVGTTAQTFLGLTVNCARCHDHKFDPVTQAEYYQFAAALSGVRHGDRQVTSPAIERLIEELTERQAALLADVQDIESPVIAAIRAQREDASAGQDPPRPTARWMFDGDLRDSVGELHGTGTGSARVESGQLVLDGESFVRTTPLPHDVKEKTLEAWVRLDNLDQRGGGVVSLQTRDGVLFDAIVFGEREPRRWMAGSNGFARTQSFGGSEEAEAASQLIHVAIVYTADGTITAYRDGVPYGSSYESSGPLSFAADEAEIVFGLRHGTSAGGNRMLSGAIEEARFYDRALTPAEIAASAGRADVVSEEQLLAAMTADQRSRRAELLEAAERLTERLRNLSDRTVYAVAPREPDPTHLLLRGNPGTPGDVVAPAGISSLHGVPSDFSLAPDASDSLRRQRLAEWITSPQNPLFTRVIVNRIWQHHFGAGLVETSNDFGFNGTRPSHPELLDYLASQLAAHEWSLKWLHREIVTSATYRQSSRYRPECAAVDGGNRLLWRRSPQRLEAEALRDTVLATAGQLNTQIGGPSYRDFVTFVQNSQFYEMIDPVGFEFNRRTVYRMWLRSGRNGLLDTFDCPDPSTTAPRRAVTTTPVQSLALLNNSFIMRMAEAFAQRIADDVGEEPEAQVRRAAFLAYGRTLDDGETTEAATFVRRHGLAAYCRVIFNSNEFLYVD